MIVYKFCLVLIITISSKKNFILYLQVLKFYQCINSDIYLFTYFDKPFHLVSY